MDDSPRGSGFSYCPDCGEELLESMNFCPNCGLDCRTLVRASAGDSGESEPARPDGERDAGTVTDRDVLEHRISSAIAEGWELEHDFGDHAVMIHRSIGDTGMHVLIAFATIWWTMGVGNALYGAYCYYGNPQRAVVRADGVEGTGTETDAPSTSKSSAGWLLLSIVGALYIWTVAAIVGVIALALTPSVAGVVLFIIAFAIAAGGASVLPPVRRRLRRRHSVTTNGTTRVVDERVVYETDEPCAGCYAPVGRGIERTYREEFCVLGVPITSSEGTNLYCRECANGNTATESSEAPTENRELDLEST